MSKLSPQQFKDYLMQIRRLAEGPLEEIQKEVEVTNKFPQEFYDLAIENDLYRCDASRRIRRIWVVGAGDPSGTGGIFQGTGRNEDASALCNGSELEDSG